jgi:dTDP-glucose 4,6-dehydratase
MKKVLLTGASGFIGQHILPELREDYEVHAIAINREYRKNNKDNDVHVHHADIKDHKAINAIVKKVAPDYIIHLAGISSVAKSFDDYNSTMESNYYATVNLAEACRREGSIKQFIFAGSSEEYGAALKNAKQRITEDTPLNPTSPYAVSKANADMYLQYLGKAYGFPYTVIRSFNTYGRKDNNSFFVEKTISKMLLQEQSISLGDPSLIRDWLYVDDHVSGYIKVLGNKRAIGQTIQLCTGKGHSIRETAELISKMTGFEGDILWNTMPRRPFEASIMIGDNSKAKELLGWEPKYTLEQGLEKTIAFWKEKMEG